MSRTSIGPLTSVASIGLLVLMAGCGGGSTSTSGAGTGGAGSSGSGSSASGSGRSNQPSSSAVTTVALAPVTYTANGPCAGVATDQPLAATPPACMALWTIAQSSTVPGQSLMRSSPLPRQVQVPDGLDPTAAAAWATAYVRTAAFQAWGEDNAHPVMVGALDPAEHPGGPIENALQAGGSATLPPCSYPTKLAAVILDDTSRAHLISVGWKTPSKWGILATFPPCSGIVVRYPNGQTLTLGAATAPVTILTAGTVVDRPLFGTVWAIDGEGYCGPAEFKAVCAFAP